MKLTTDDRQAIDGLRREARPTRRPTVDALEEVLYEPLPVLDHGFVRVVDYMGDDAAIVQAARVSYGKGTTAVRQDRGLIRYLLRHRHLSPFEMCELKLHVKLPIFVARQWIRHRTANVNEYSARYSILDNEFYLPRPEHLSAQARSNRQGRDESHPLPPEQAAHVLELLRADAEQCYAHYEELLRGGAAGEASPGDETAERGLARELARINLTLGAYTQWYWKVDLRNLLHFLSLRLEAHAQLEIRLYAEVIGQLVQKWVPHVWEAFVDYHLESVTISRQEVAALRAWLHGETPDLESLGLTAREATELRARFEGP
jgi:thymidylate synthase (FAD)